MTGLLNTKLSEKYAIFFWHVCGSRCCTSRGHGIFSSGVRGSFIFLQIIFFFREREVLSSQIEEPQEKRGLASIVARSKPDLISRYCSRVSSDLQYSFRGGPSIAMVCPEQYDRLIWRTRLIHSGL